MPRLREVVFHLWNRAGGRRIALLASLAAVLLATAPADASKRMQPLTRAAVASAWVGISEDELYIFRLSLAADGGGSGAYSFVDEPPRVFRISAWKYEPPSIRIKIESVDQSPLVAEQLEGKIVGVRMNLRMAGSGWSRSLMFRREEVLVGRWARVKDAMSRFEHDE